MAITVKELEDVKLEIIENIETILRVEDVAVAEMDKMAVVKMLIMSAALVGVAIEYASEDEAMRDAAEFEARVASLLSSCIYGRFRCEGIINGRPHCPREVAMGGCDACRLMQARLAVESEMDAEHGNEA